MANGFDKYSAYFMTRDVTSRRSLRDCSPSTTLFTAVVNDFKMLSAVPIHEESQDQTTKTNIRHIVIGQRHKLRPYTWMVAILNHTRYVISHVCIGGLYSNCDSQHMNGPGMSLYRSGGYNDVEIYTRNPGNIERTSVSESIIAT